MSFEDPRDLTLAQYARVDYDDADDAIFKALDYAAQQVVVEGGPRFHSRYDGVKAVGLAVAIGRDTGENFYNPLWVDDKGRERTFDTFDYLRYNYRVVAERPDAKLLSTSEIPERVSRHGRFVVNAAAKIHRLANNPQALTSHRPEGMITGVPGEIGAAGGRRFIGEQTLGAASGLWEVHDHIAISIFSFWLQTARNVAVSDAQLRISSETLRQLILEDFREQCEAVQAVVDEAFGKPADQLNPPEVGRVLGLIDQSYLEKLEDAA